MSIRRFLGRKKSNRASTSTSDVPREMEIEALNIDYCDPTIYKRVVDEEQHIHQKIIEHPQGGLITFRGNWSGPIKAYKQRCSLVPQVKQLIDQAGWHRFFLIDTEKSSMKFVEALVERWWDTTHTFHLPCGEIGFTPLDWAMLTGLSIGSGDPPPYSDEEYNFEMVQTRFFPDITSSDWKLHGIRCSFLKKYFTRSMMDAALSDDELVERIVRAYFMFFLGEFLFPNAASVISSGWLAAFEDVSRVGTYDWGSQALALMYISLDACSRLKIKSFNGPWQVLEYWAIEHMHICVPISRRMDMEDVIAAANIRPRIARWNRDQLEDNRTDHIRHNISIVRNQLEMRSVSSIIWEPYVGFDNDPEIQAVTNLSRQRVIFQYCQQGVWYLGDRCYRQITGITAIPRDPPNPMSYISARDYCQPISVDTLVQEVSQTTYDQYWARVSVGAILPTLLHAANVDFIGPASINDPSAQLPFQPPPFWLPGVYRRQAEVDAHPRHHGFVVEVPLSQDGTVTMPLDNEPFPIEERGQLSYEETHRRYQQMASEAAQLRRFIMCSTVLRDDVPYVPRRTSVSVDRVGPSWDAPRRTSMAVERVEPSWDPWVGRSTHQIGPTWDQWVEQSSQIDYVPSTQFDDDQ